MKIGCVIMMSGEGKRFGSNKLLTDFKGRPLCSYALELAKMFEKTVAVTRSPEVKEICDGVGVECILHSFPQRSDTVRLGIGKMNDTDGCCFMNADQPLLRKESIHRLIEAFYEHRSKICRLSYDNQAGNPVIFPKEMYAELKSLPEGKGGGFLTKKYPEQVVCVPARDKYELFDIDTKDDMLTLLAYPWEG